MNPMNRLLQQIIFTRNDPAGRADISAKIGAFLDDLFKDGSYKLSVKSNEDILKGIDIRINASIYGYKIVGGCVLMPDSEALNREYWKE